MRKETHAAIYNQDHEIPEEAGKMDDTGLAKQKNSGSSKKLKIPK